MQASVYVMMSDGDLADQAKLIVVGTVLDRKTGFSKRPIMRYQVRVEEVVKGDLPTGIVEVDVLGGQTISGMNLSIHAVPQFEIGDRTILYLMPNRYGTYGILQLMLGAFREVRIAGSRLAVRDLREAREVFRSPQGSQFRRHRDFERFSRWLADHAAGQKRTVDYFLTPIEEETQPQPTIDEFNLSKRDDRFARWFSFDEDNAIGWEVHSAGQDGLDGGGTSEFQAALQAWNDDSDSTIAYNFSGTTDIVTGFTEFDDINTMIFEDPNDEISGSFDCDGGGTLAIGGAWSGVPFNEFKGREFRTIVAGDIIIQDGVSCVFEASPNSSKLAEELYAHELGHTLGVSHSCGDEGMPSCTDLALAQALMTGGGVHDDGRGAALNVDDRAAISFLYGASMEGPESSVFVFPQVGNGQVGIIQFTTNFLFEQTGSDTIMVLDFFSTPNGDPMVVELTGQGTNSTFEIEIDRGETVSLVTSGIGSLQVGYARVTASSGLVGTAVFTRVDGGTTVTEAGVLGLTPGQDWSFVVDTREAKDSGVAIVNPPANGTTSTAMAEVILRLYDSQANLLGTDTRVMANGAHLAEFVTQIFSGIPDVDEMFGSMTIESDQPVVLVNLRQNDDPNVAFPGEVPILTAISAAKARADSQAATGTFTVSNRALSIQVMLKRAPSVVNTVYRIYEKDIMLTRQMRATDFSRTLQADIRLPPIGLSAQAIRASVQFVYENGSISEEIFLRQTDK